MQTNSFWNLLIKISSFFAIVFLLLGAGLMFASYSGWTGNKLAGVLTIFFAVVLSVFSLVAVNFSNFKLKSELDEATEIANLLSQGRLFEEETDFESELIGSFRKISDYRK